MPRPDPAADHLPVEQQKRLTPDQVAEEMERWDRLIWKIALKWHKRNPRLELEDIYSEVRLGFLIAATRYDPERGFRFSTYASWWGSNYAREYCRRELGRGVRTARRGSPGTNPFGKAVVKVKSLSRPMLSKDGTTWATLIPADPKKDELRESDWWDQVLSTLSPGPAKILRMRFLQNLTAVQISKVLGVSRQRVWQIQQKSLQQLKADWPRLEWELSTANSLSS